MNNLLTSLISVIPFILSALVNAQQEPLAGTHRSQQLSPVDLNFTTLFAPSAVVDAKSGPAARWSVSTWNGLTTYAHATPLRCLGGDEGVPYDVAVLGTFYDRRTEG